MTELFLVIVMVTFFIGVPWLAMQSTHRINKDKGKVLYWDYKNGTYVDK